MANRLQIVFNRAVFEGYEGGGASASNWLSECEATEKPWLKPQMKPWLKPKDKAMVEAKDEVMVEATDEAHLEYGDMAAINKVLNSADHKNQMQSSDLLLVLVAIQLTLTTPNINVVARFFTKKATSDDSQKWVCSTPGINCNSVLSTPLYRKHLASKYKINAFDAI
ncbi:unnamed protein product [Peronospora belbahrii]|uniref:Uncharacterized protein n=1 Tax=Peronospora belbahrii TaxID=622444 RepID=A0AAU9L0H2_9STRA|nr:unnamed protein product [Peronospora belbahrii]